MTTISETTISDGFANADDASLAAALAQMGAAYLWGDMPAIQEARTAEPVNAPQYTESESQQAYSPQVVAQSAPAQSASAPSGSEYATQSASSSEYVGHVPVATVRADFPILSERVSGGKPLVWFDNGATTQKPRAVIDRLSAFYAHENSNVHRGAHELAERATNAYENAREKTASFLGAPDSSNIIFVRGTTEGINLVAHAYVEPLLRANDEIILTVLEHHANIVPWQIIAERTGARIRVAPVDDSGQLIVGEYARLFNAHTKFVAVTHVSNALGTITPIEELVSIAHAHGVRILIDGAQSTPHIPINVSANDADFFVFSGHKIFAPTGIGVLYGKSDALAAARPYQSGGNMIADVTFERTVYQEAPMKFEAGTGNIADAAGLAAALDYVSALGMANIAAREHELLEYGTVELQKIPGLHLVGTSREKASVLSFVLDGHSVESVGTRLSAHGIAVRAGHHCAQPIHRRFGLEGTVRPSLAFYNTFAEIDTLVRALRELV